MNPSQNDSFGSFSNGQGGNVGQASGYSGGSTATGSNGQFGGYSAGGQVFSSAPMSGAASSGGDIVMSGRKSRKWLVVLVVVLLFAAVAGGVFAVWKSGVLGGSKDGYKMTVKDSFNEYVNYVLYGLDSKTDINYDSLAFIDPYFYSIRDNDTLLKQYIEVANDKYISFSELYHNEDGAYNIDALWVYFQEYPSIYGITDSEIAAEYVEVGADETKNLIYKKYSLNNGDEYLNDYSLGLRQLAEFQLGLIVKASEKGCLGENGCNVISDEEQMQWKQIVDKIDGAIYRMNENASGVLDELYAEIYEEGA